MISGLERLVSALKNMFLPLSRSIKDPARLRRFLRSIGWVVEADDKALAASPLSALGAAADATVTALAAAEAAARTGKADPSTISAAVESAIELFESIRALSSGGGGPGALGDPALYRDLGEHLAGLLLTRYLEMQRPAVFAALQLLGFVIEDAAAADPDDPRHAAEHRVPHRSYRLNLSGLSGLTQDPLALVRDAWVRDGRIDGRVVEVLRDLLLALGVPVRLPPLRPAFVAQHYEADEESIQVEPVEDDAEQLAPTRELVLPFFAGVAEDGDSFVEVGLSVFAEPRGGLIVANYGEAAMNTAVQLGSGWSLNLGWALDASGALALRVAPSGVTLASELPQLAVSAGLTGAPAKPWVLLGTAEKPALWLKGLVLGIELKVKDLEPEVIVRFGTPDGGKSGGLGFRLDTSGADGFLAELLAGIELEAEFGMAARWSSRTGLDLKMSGGFELVWVMERKLGPVLLRTARLGVGPHAQALRIDVAVAVSAEIGPFTATVQDIGLRLDVGAAEPGSALPVRTGLGFKPPKGIGLAIDSETVKGGGFLEIDVEAGRYAGVLELVTPSFSLTALGILNTKIPGEPRGWALFFALTATFSPPIQLGFGFVLSGVGGLFAVNRRLDEPAMREAVRGGNLDSVLFPNDVVKEAPRIFATVESMFPIAKGSFVFGPMIKVGWGTPPLVEAMIGVFVSLPRPLIIALLGRVRCALPTPKKPILLLNMDVAGSINFGAGTVGLDAQIHDSSLFGLELTGAMAFRARFKDQPGFLLSVGGFHPAFVPPADVGKLTRMGMSLRLGKQENILVTLSSYFALTSNTLQFGAAIDVSASVRAFKVAGGAYFDALIVYKPFHFTAGMGAYFSVSWREWDLLAVRVALVLDGPGPWRAQGVASFTIAGFEKSFEFDETFGDKIAASSERAPVAAPLREALAEPRNWGAEPGGFTSLRLRDLSANDAGPIVVAPDARVGFRQRVVPLGLKLEQMGPAEPQEPGPFEVQVLAVDTQKPAVLSVLTELFAPAAFLDLSDEEKLTAPSFEPMKAGVAFGDRWTAPEEQRHYTVAEDSDERYEQKGELWPKASPPSVEVVVFAQRVRRPGETWKLKRVAVTVAPARYVRAGGEGVAEVDAPAVAWHEARAACSAGERVVPVHSVRKVGR